MRRFVILLLTMLWLLSPAWAERADQDKPTQVDADHFLYDEKTQTKTFTGNVVVTRGTLLMKAYKIVIIEDKTGNQLATLYSNPGKLVSFKQKSDGGPDLWISGHAKRVEYDDDAGLIKLFDNAELTRTDQGKVIDQSEGTYMSYDSRTELLNVANTTSGVSTPQGGRVRVIIQPGVQNGSGSNNGKKP